MVLHFKCDFGCQTKHVPPNFDDPRCMMISRFPSWNALTDLMPEIRSSVYWRLFRTCHCGQEGRIHWKGSWIQKIRGCHGVYEPWFICQLLFRMFIGMFCQTKHVPPNFDDPRCMMISRIASCNALTDLKPEIRSSIYCSGHGTVVKGGGFTEKGAEYRRLEVVMVFINLDSSATLYFGCSEVCFDL